MADLQARILMAKLVCELREADDPNLELKTGVIKEAMERLSVHHLELFDNEVEAMMASRKGGRT